MHVFKGHKNIVNCIDVIDTDIYSGSWDTTIIQWNRSVRKFNSRRGILYIYIGDTQMEFNVSNITKSTYTAGSACTNQDLWINLSVFGVQKCDIIYQDCQMCQSS
jgi:hypothetical protein